MLKGLAVPMVGLLPLRQVMALPFPLTAVQAGRQHTALEQGAEVAVALVVSAHLRLVAMELVVIPRFKVRQLVIA
jgi:hypothetical protein